MRRRRRQPIESARAVPEDPPSAGSSLRARGFRLAAGLAASLLVGCGASSTETYSPEFDSHPLPSAGAVLIFGVHPLHNPQRLQEAYGPIADYLSRHLTNVQVRLEASRSYDEFERKLADRHFEIALPNPYQALVALGHGYRIFGKMGDDEKFRGILLVRKDGGIREVADLAGQTVSFPAPTALAATMMPLYFLRSRGLDVNAGIRRLYAGSQESSIMSVYLGRSAAAATWPPPWEAFAKRSPEIARDLIVRWETPPLVNNALIARDDVPQQTVAVLAALLFSLHTSEEGRRLLEALPLSRFEAASETTYLPVRAFLTKYSEVVR